MSIQCPKWPVFRDFGASRTHLWPIFMEYAIEIVTYGMLEGSRVQKVGFSGLKGQFNVIKGLIVKIGHLRPILAARTHLLPILCFTSWEMFRKVCWRYSRAQK